MLLAKSQRFDDPGREGVPGPIYNPKYVAEPTTLVPRLPPHPPADSPRDPSRSRIPWVGRRMHVKNDICIVGQGPIDVAYIGPQSFNDSKAPSACVSTGPRFEIYGDKENKQKPGPEYNVVYNDIAFNADKKIPAPVDMKAKKKKEKARLARFHGKQYTEVKGSPGPAAYNDQYRPHTVATRIGNGRRWLATNEYLGKAYEKKNLAVYGPGPMYNINERPMTEGACLRSTSNYSVMSTGVDRTRVFNEKTQARNTWTMGVVVNGTLIRRNENDCGSNLGPGALMLPSQFQVKSFNCRVRPEIKAINKQVRQVASSESEGEEEEEEDDGGLSLEVGNLSLEGGPKGGAGEQHKGNEAGGAGDKGKEEEEEDEEKKQPKKRRVRKKKQGPLWLVGDKYTDTGRDIIRKYRDRRAALLKHARQPKMMMGTSARGHHSEAPRSFSGVRNGTRQQTMQHMLHLWEDSEEPPEWDLKVY